MIFGNFFEKWKFRSVEKAGFERVGLSNQLDWVAWMERNGRAEALLKVWRESSSQLVRRKAAEALGRLGDARALEALINTAQEEKKSYPSPQYDALEALGCFADARAVDTLIKVLQGPPGPQAGYAARALGKHMDKDRVRDALFEALPTNSTAAEALGIIAVEWSKSDRGRTIVATARERLLNQPANLTMRAWPVIQACKLSPRDNAERLLFKFSEAIYPTPGPRNLEKFRAVLDDAQRENQMNLLARPMCDIVLGTWPGRDLDYLYVRIRSIEALVNLPSASVTKVLEVCIRGSEHVEIRMAAVRCLARRGTEADLLLIVRSLATLPFGPDTEEAIGFSVKWGLSHSPDTRRTLVKSLVQMTRSLGTSAWALGQIKTALTSTTATSLSDTELRELAHLEADVPVSDTFVDTDGCTYYGTKPAPANCSTIHALANREIERRTLGRHS